MSSVKRTAAFTTFGASLHAAQFARGSSDCPRRSVQCMLRRIALFAGLAFLMPCDRSLRFQGTSVIQRLPNFPIGRFMVALHAIVRSWGQMDAPARGTRNVPT